MTPGEEAEMTKLLGSGAPVAVFRGGIVTADTFHTPGSTYDYGWNALTRQFIVTDPCGDQHIAIHRRTTMSSGATRRVYYIYALDDTSKRAMLDITPLGESSSWPWIDITSDCRAVITWHNGIAERIIVDSAPGWGFFSVKPHPMDPNQNPLYPSLAVDKTIDRLYWWSTGVDYTAFGDSQAVYFTDDGGSTWDSTEIVWDMTNTGGFWSGSAIAISKTGSNLAIWQRYNDVPISGDTMDMVLYSRSEDRGESWIILACPLS